FAFFAPDSISCGFFFGLGGRICGSTRFPLSRNEGSLLGSFTLAENFFFAVFFILAGGSKRRIVSPRAKSLARNPINNTAAQTPALFHQHIHLPPWMTLTPRRRKRTHPKCVECGVGS